MRLGADWVDLDPVLPNVAFCATPAGTGVELVSAEPSHEVTLTLEIERLRDGQFQREQILSKKFEVPDLVETPITLIFCPQTEGVGGIVTEALGGLQGQQSGMVATLLVNQTATRSKTFVAPGVAATTTNFFAAEQEEIVTALRLRISSTAPGEPEQTEDRVIFDVVPEQLRSAGGEQVRVEDLVAPAAGIRFPASLESLRQVVLGNGGLSTKLASVRMLGVLADLPEAMRLADAGIPDPEIAVWNHWVQASLVALAAEELIRTRPVAADGSCVLVDRPRVLISGIMSGPGGQPIHWVDWALDDVGIAGPAEPGSAWRHRVWHRALQSALETEMLMDHVEAPDDAVPLLTHPLMPVDPILVWIEAVEDSERGFRIFASADMRPEEWWRIHPEMGRNDTRFRFLGNARPMNSKPGLGTPRAGSSSISEAEMVKM
ncbi:hypothetical protein [Pseudohalocynthiibacter sp. F2068]|jgi:hypothetical protein|uniref:hypothetical protein n=1 Tax=Pseudohalocynthiibacter sp. F2068 TaxID=2926418 RepID=UPI001FF3C8AB|nr:hypothetical protein [Pseudohalocynthiibacter sp. F2068]MCK0100728.1 hypothetical protein [Pseudohalocynthiibacter sp. F2068]